MTSVTRRRALVGTATAGIGVPLLAACGDDQPVTADPATPTSSAATATPPADPTDAAEPTEPAEPAGSTDPTSAPADGLVAAADVPVGGGVILKDEEVVVTQPSAGEFKAFSAICTHRSCLVSSVADQEIHCVCHGSVFSAVDGSVESGQATRPLPAVAVQVVDGQVART